MSEPSRSLLYLRPRQLATAFRDDRLQERNKYHLVLLGSGLQLVFGGQGFLFTSRSAGNTQLFVIALAIMVWGIHASYKVNSHGDGRAFVERFVCLSVPISIYATLANAIAAFVIRGLTGGGAATSDPTRAFASFGFSVSMYVAVYLALRFYVGIASSASVPTGDRAIASSL